MSFWFENHKIILIVKYITGAFKIRKCKIQKK